MNKRLSDASERNVASFFWGAGIAIGLGSSEGKWVAITTGVICAGILWLLYTLYYAIERVAGRP